MSETEDQERNGRAALPHPWHKLHQEAYDLADAEACGAIAGHLAGVGEPFTWTSNVVAAVRAATAVAFDHGFEAAHPAA